MVNSADPSPACKAAFVHENLNMDMMLQNRKYLVGGLLALVIALSGCRDTGVQETAYPDIEAHILTTYPDGPQRDAALQAARAMELVFTVDLDDREALQGVVRQLARADHCIYTTFGQHSASKPAAQVALEIEKMALTTAARKERYRAFNMAMDGAAWSTPRGNTCDWH